MDITESRQYLSFVLKEEVYAIDVGQVREILEYTKVTKIPKCPQFMRGVINVRGSVIPVIDLNLKFGMEQTKNTVNTCIIVIEVDVNGSSMVLGALADSVKEVFELSPGDIEPAPNIGSNLDTEFIKGIGNVDDTFIIILDIDKIFSTEELVNIQKVKK